jgi:hypothetical protein
MEKMQETTRAPSSGIPMTLRLVPPADATARRVELVGPALIKHVQIGRWRWRPGDGIGEKGALVDRLEQALCSPKMPVDVTFTTTGPGDVTASVEFEGLSAEAVWKAAIDTFVDRHESLEMTAEKRLLFAALTMKRLSTFFAADESLRKLALELERRIDAILDESAKHSRRGDLP